MCNFISNISKQILFSSAVVLSVVFFYPQIVFAGGGGGGGGGDGSGATAQEAIRDARNNAARSGQGQPGGINVIRQSDGSYVAHNQFDGGGNGSGNGNTPAPGPASTPLPPPAPDVTLTAIINSDEDNPHTGSIAVVPSDDVRIEWGSSAALGQTVTCQGGGALSGESSASGSYEVSINDFNVGETRTYEMTCTTPYSHGLDPSTTESISVTLLGLDLNLSLDREIIRAGETVTMDWDVSFPDGAEATAHGNNLPDTLDCDLAGAIRQEIDIQANPNGSATSGPIFNFFNNRLRCVYPDSVHEFSVTTPLEVIPAPRER